MKNNPPVFITDVKPKNPKPAWCVKWADPRFDMVFAVCYFDGHFVIYQLHEDKKVSTLFSFNMESSVNKCDFAPWGLGLKVVAVSSEGRGLLVSKDDYSFSATPFEAHRGAMATSVSWAPASSIENFLDNKEKKKARSIFATSGLEGVIAIWEVVTSPIDPKKSDIRCLFRLADAHQSGVRDISWSSNGFISSLILASGGDDKKAKIFKVEFKQEPNQPLAITEAWTKSYESPVWKVGFNFSGNLLAVSYSNAQDVTVVEVLSEKDRNKWEPIVESKNEN